MAHIPLHRLAMSFLGWMIVAAFYRIAWWLKRFFRLD
jgi:hypothetical protein